MADSATRLEQAAVLSTRAGNVDAAIDFTRKVVEMDEMFEKGYVKNAGAVKKNLEKLIAQRDRARAKRDAEAGRTIAVPE